MCLAVPGKVLDCDETSGVREGRVQFAGIVRRVRLDFVPEAAGRRLRDGARRLRHQPRRHRGSGAHTGFALRDGSAGGFAGPPPMGKMGKMGRRDGEKLFGELVKYIDEYRDHRIAHALAAEITSRASRRWVLMEICGGQTHTIMRYGLDELLGDKHRAGARPRLPCLRHSAGDDRQGHRTGIDSRMSRWFPTATCSGFRARARTCSRPRPKAAMCALPTLRWRR